jgi:hypothetical protein
MPHLKDRSAEDEGSMKGYFKQNIRIIGRIQYMIFTTHFSGQPLLNYEYDHMWEKV